MVAGESTTENENSPERLDCDICGLKDIHHNDYANHMKSRRHKSKLRRINRQESSDDIQRFVCEHCKTTLTDLEFYKIHMGSKTHKRNLRKLGIKDECRRQDVPDPKQGRGFAMRAIICVPESGDSDLEETNFVRKKYKTRNITTDEDYYKSYIYSITAFLSLRLAFDPAVKDFLISVNDKMWKSFGDIVIDVAYKEKHTLYAIKCKNVTTTYKEVNTLNEAKVIMEKEYRRLTELRTIHEFDKVKFVIFTTCSTTSSFCKTAILTPKILNEWRTKGEKITEDKILLVNRSTKKNEIVNVTADCENIFSFHLSENEKETVTLPNVYFYTHQWIHPGMLQQLLNTKFDNIPDVTKEYQKYIESWSEGKLGGNYKLRKKDIILKVGEILLNPYVVMPKKISLDYSSYDIWNRILDKVDLTVVKNDPFVISKMCQPLNKIIEETLAAKIDTIDRSISIKKIDDIGDPKLKAYYCEEIQNNFAEDTHILDIYKIFWKAEKIPLLMSCEDKEERKSFVIDVINFMKQNGVDKKFLLKTAEPHMVRPKGNMIIFTNLNDIKRFVNLEDILIRNIGSAQSFNLSLKTIEPTDPFFCRSVDANMFFDMALGKYTLRANKGKRDEQNEMKIILNDELKEKLKCLLYPKEDDESNLPTVPDSRYEISGRLRGIDPRLF